MKVENLIEFWVLDQNFSVIQNLSLYNFILREKISLANSITHDADKVDMENPRQIFERMRAVVVAEG